MCMTLHAYLSSFKNDEEASRFLNIKPRTIGAWRRGERIPRPAQARYLVQKSQYLLTLDDIYGESSGADISSPDSPEEVSA